MTRLVSARSGLQMCYLRLGQDSDVYLSDVLERPELANKEQREWAAVEAYVAAANVAKIWA